MEQQTPIPPPKSRMKAREEQKRAIFPSLIWGGGGSRFSIYFVQECNLGQNKMEQQTPSPPNQGWRRAKGKNAPFSHPWFGGGEGGLGFPFILSKIVGLVQFEEQFVFLDKYNIIHQDLDYFLQYRTFWFVT